MLKWIAGFIGLLVGNAVGRWHDGLTWMLGAFMVGAAIDWLLANKSDANAQKRDPRADLDTERIDAALSDIHWRLKRLEEAAALGASPMMAAKTGQASGAAGAPGVAQTAAMGEAAVQAGAQTGSPAGAQTDRQPEASAAQPAVPNLASPLQPATAASSSSEKLMEWAIPAAVPQNAHGMAVSTGSAAKALAIEGGVASAAAAPPAASAPSATAAAKTTPAPRAPAAPPPAPREPAAIDVAIESAKQWFSGGNAVAKVGILILFFGVGFLIKYAADRDILPIELRLAAVAAGAIIMLFLGFRLVARNLLPENHGLAREAALMAQVRQGYGMALQGAGIGLLYFTIFGAFRYYQLMPQGAAFCLMVLVVVLAGILAVKQNALALAVFGSVGGFLAPVLASTGQGSHVALFSFYALLNVGIAGIAWFKSWRVLNVLGFLFTFVIGTLWGVTRYAPENYATTQPFLAFFFLLYVFIAVRYALRESPKLTHHVDGTLVFGTPIVAFGLQAGLVQHLNMGAAFSAVGLSAFYLLLATWIKGKGDSLKLLGECFLALGVIFVTLAVPLALDGRWTAGVWALEGAAIVWVGMRQARKLARAFGYAVMAGGALAFFTDLPMVARDVMPLFNARWVGMALIALSALFVARLTERQAHAEAEGGDVRLIQGESALGTVWLVWGVAWWLVAGAWEVERLVESKKIVPPLVMFFAASALAAQLCAIRLRWVSLANACLVLLPLMWAAATFGMVGHMLGVVASRTASVNLGWIAWPLGLAVLLWVLRRADRESDEGARDEISGSWFVGTVWLIALLGIWELRGAAREADLAHSVWSTATLVLPLVVLTLVLTSQWAARLWPMLGRSATILAAGLGPLAVLSVFWVYFANWMYRGNTGGLTYVPFLNALDIAHGFVFLALIAWWRACRRGGVEPAGGLASWGGMTAVTIFFWLNGVLLRTLHHWAGVPYRFDDLMRSTLVQMSFSIFWTILALVLMVVAHRRAVRRLWMAGAGLMALVVGKLLLVDSANAGTIERIVAFIVVGLLMLGIGYFAPLPAKKGDE